MFTREGTPIRRGQNALRETGVLECVLSLLRLPNENADMFPNGMSEETTTTNKQTKFTKEKKEKEKKKKSTERQKDQKKKREKGEKDEKGTEKKEK